MKIQGVIPALVTPLNEDESINVAVLDKLINRLIDEKADGFYIGGATGEGFALKTENRMILTEQALKSVNKRTTTIVQVAAADFSDAIALAKHAEAHGADAISATPPAFFEYDDNDVYNYYKKLAGAVNIPVMVYYCPLAGFNVSAQLAAKLFHDIDNVTSIKWTSANYYEMMRLKELTNGELDVINGRDEMLLMGLSAGADGGIGSNYNYMLKNFKSIYDNFKKGDIASAQAAQFETNRIISALLKNRIIPTVKLVLEAQGYNVGNATFPMPRYSDAEREQILNDFRAAGLKI